MPFKIRGIIEIQCKTLVFNADIRKRLGLPNTPEIQAVIDDYRDIVKKFKGMQ